MSPITVRQLAPLACALMLFATACGGSPTTVLAEAEGAKADARLAEKCAPADFAAAQRALDKARAHDAAEEYEEAEAQARTARQLFARAQEKALARKDECEKEPEPVKPEVNPEDFIADDMNAGPGEAAPQVEALQTIYFSFNAFDLTADARRILASNSGWLSGNPETKIVVEGHCDSRGSSEYNLALGEKRAQVVRKYLKSLGVAEDRMALISYGEEKPADFGDDDAARGRNRRVEFTPR